VAKIDTDNLKGGNVVAGNFPRGGKNKSRVALICHLFGIDMPLCWHAKLKGGNYIVYAI